MKHSTIQVMIRGERVGAATAVVVGYPGVKVLDWHRASNSHYLFVHLLIGAATRPGKVRIEMKGTGAIDFPLYARRAGNGTAYAQGVTSADFIYFLMPDRFSNGNPGNDRIPGMRDQSLDRDSMYFRHGGDFEGIINHLDYLQRLGVTALWMTPVLENNMPNRTEHGYAFTDHYIIDPRLGGAEGYRRLSDALHRRGMKLIQDAVLQPCGALSISWCRTCPIRAGSINGPSYTPDELSRASRSWTRMPARSTANLSGDGWFTRQMPDLNQGNPDLADFLIQHAIWCVETFGVDALCGSIHICITQPGRS